MPGKDLIGRGWPFPIRPGPDGRLRLVGGERKIQESMWVILSTTKGERVMRPDFGGGVPSYVFAPNDPRTRARMAESARRALLRYEPRIDVLQVRAEPDPDDAARVLLIIDYRIRSTNAAHNLVYPFYLTEGVS